ncbi:MAG: response regulator [Bryobacteraceae bacterium]|jgi:two-component system cell cycle sensor histidine kinase/response regulator CckA
MGSVGKKTRVLVVDDEPDVRSFVRTVLVRQGYEVLEAEDGLAAYELVERLSGEIELLVTDVKMPRMDGITLGQKVSTGYPEIGVLYISAYISEAPGRGRRFLPKPFRPDALVDCIRSLSA